MTAADAEFLNIIKNNISTRNQQKPLISSVTEGDDDKLFCLSLHKELLKAPEANQYDPETPSITAWQGRNSISVPRSSQAALYVNSPSTSSRDSQDNVREDRTITWDTWLFRSLMTVGMELSSSSFTSPLDTSVVPAQASVLVLRERLFRELRSPSEKKFLALRYRRSSDGRGNDVRVYTIQ
ncbi:unnamed protein product [Leptidea sinapis]|uniref:Uncharacterized protein n=1 Tax=Leptidea sinapis TaxID=189913 RepID=A0A5E4QDE3_9NEOP|nr:unnamed protein product [Leptidea sinapis]